MFATEYNYLIQWTYKDISMMESICPNCDFEIALTEPQMGQILECPNCYQPIEVVSVSPLKFAFSQSTPNTLKESQQSSGSTRNYEKNYVDLSAKGLKYDVRSPLVSRLLRGTISRRGFAPLQHVSLMQLTRFRMLPTWFPYAGLLICLFSLFVTTTVESSTGWTTAGLVLGAVMILGWLFAIETVITVDSEGHTFLYIWFDDRVWAEQLIETYERLTTQ